jgi:biflaviolin synthase
MTESSLAREQVVHDWPVDHLPGTQFDPLLARLLRDEPIARIRLRYGEGHAWLVTRYEDVKLVGTDPRFSRAATVDSSVTTMTPHVIGLPQGIGRTDPPDHTRLRRVLTQCLGPRAVQRLRPGAELVADGLLTRLARREPPADLRSELVAPLTMRVISDLLGVDEPDWERVRGWQRVILSSDHSLNQANAVKKDIAGYFSELADRRTAEPGDDVFSALVAARDAGEMSTPELISLAGILQLNGMDMVLNAGSTMVYLLLTRPEWADRLRHDLSLLPAAIEEMFRFNPNRNGVGLPRIATCDIQVGHVTVRAGEAVYVSYMTANRDPAVFPDPDRLDPDRSDNPHLTFGYGPHFCPGAALTRMELNVLLSALLSRLPGLALACPPADLEWLQGTVNRGPTSLPVTW